MVNLKTRILVPLLVLFVFIFVTVVLYVLSEEQQAIQKELNQKVTSISNYYRASLTHRAEKMLGLAEILAMRNDIKAALVKKNREELYTLSKDVFMGFKDKYRITHFYYHSNSGVNILRVHQLDRHGDKIERFTMQSAIKSGDSSYGIELGPLGTFTLRVVVPINTGTKTVGYLELGEDINDLVEELSRAFGVDLVLTVDKAYINKSLWIEGMKMLGRMYNWDRYEQQVAVAASLDSLPTDLELDDQRVNKQADWLFDGTMNTSLYTTSLHLKDAGNRDVGSIYILLDVGKRLNEKYYTLLWLVAVSGGIGITFFLFVYWMLLKVERMLTTKHYDLINSQRDLKTAQQLAGLGNWEWIPNSENFRCSDELGRILGINKRIDISFQDFRELVVTDDKEDFDQFIATVLSSRQISETQTRILRGDGDIRYLQQTAELQLTEDQGYKIVCAVLEITDKKRAELLAVRMGHLLETSWYEIFIFDCNDLHFLQMSRGAREKLGFGDREIAASAILDIMPDLSRETFNKLVEPMLKGDSRFAIYEGDLKATDGSRYPVEMRIQKSVFNHEAVYLAIGKDISERKKYVQEIIANALNDSLTGLPNRVLLRDRLIQSMAIAKRQQVRVALFVIDILRLSEINDTLGHKCGDAVIIEVATRLQDAFRDSDTLGRIAGDEFALVMLDTDKEKLDLIVGKIREVMQEPIFISDTIIGVDVVVGVSLAPDHGETPQDLMRHADYAMRLAKSDKLDFNIYSAAVDPYDRRHIQLYGELRQAVKERELALYYQPKINLASGKISSVEALARWPHPKEGIISPVEFIPMVERSGLIIPFTEWVLEQAIVDCADWIGKGIPVSVGVNLSSRNLLDDKLVSHVANLLEQYKLSADKLTLEVTESSVMSHPDKAIKTLINLHEMGITLSIDDFGTGYSSLAYIKQLPVDELKIDSSFVFKMVDDESDALIVKSTIDLAHSLNLTVVAEGVESEDILDLLDAYGCDVGQGFLFGRPMALADLLHWLTTSKWGCDVLKVRKA